MPIVSANITRVFSLIAASTAFTSLISTNTALIPNASKSWNTSIEPPYRLVDATISCPHVTMFKRAFVMAAIPDAQATDASPPSSVVMRSSKAKIVGLLIRVYENPVALL